MMNIFRAAFAFTISLLILCVGTASAELVIDQNYQLVSSIRVGRTAYDYTYQVNITNNGSDVQNVIAAVSSGSLNTTIIDGNVNFGDIPTGSTVAGTDTFTIRQNRSYAFDPNSLTWNVQFELAAQIIPPEGGEIQGEGGIVLIVPGGATSDPIPVTITVLQENDLGATPPPNTTFLGGAAIDMGQNELMDNADISMPAPDGVPDGAEVYLAKLVEYAGQTMYQMVDTAIVQNGIIVSQDPAFPGITTSGSYCFLWAQNVGWIEGQVTNINSGIAVPEAVVTLSGGYWLDIADASGYYGLPAWAGNFVVNAFDDQTGDFGEKQGFMPNDGATVLINVEIGESSGPTQSTLINGNFEDGLTGWVLSGAGGVVDFFGPISPYEGSYMAMISSGSGAVGGSSSALEQSFTVPEGTNKLTIHYNFISEEYPEYVGSQYNDVMRVTLHTPDGSSEIAFEEVNSANFQPVSGIPCGSGDCTWGQTGWITASIDVSQWAGTDDTLTLTVHDVGDTIYDTVVLLDGITFLDFSNPMEVQLRDITSGDIPLPTNLPDEAILIDVNILTVDELVNRLKKLTQDKGRPINRLVIYSHGHSNFLTFFGTGLTNENIDQYETSFKLLRGCLGDSNGELAHILLFSCQLAKDDEGKSLVNKLAQYTNSCVHASTDYTGELESPIWNPLYEAFLYFFPNGFSFLDWELEYNICPVTIAEVWLTTGDAGKKLQQQANIKFSNGPGSNSLQIQVDEEEFQQMDGFGAALTDSSAWLISQLPTDERNNLMSKLFSTDDDGIGISYLRLPMGASDFTKDDDVYTYNDIPRNETDWKLEQFSIDHDKEYIIPVLKEAMTINPQLKIMATPWTAPAWMKDNDSRQLKEEPGYTEIYSDYFTRFIQAYKEEGISIQSITLQNEPLHEDNNLPSMKMDWHDQVNLVVYDLVEDFEHAGIDTEIILYDHNWNDWDYALKALNDLKSYHSKQYNAISGTAFHSYCPVCTPDNAQPCDPSCTPDVQTKLHKLHPQKGIYFTEGTGHYSFEDGGVDDKFEADLVWEAQNVLIGAVRNWAKTIIWWNIALDQNGGPHLPGACGQDDGERCRGLVTINTENNQISYHVEYYTIGHASKFVSPGAHRIKSDTNTQDETIETVAFKNPDDSKVLIVLNSGTKPSEFKVLWNNQYFNYSLDKKSIATFKWK